MGALGQEEFLYMFAGDNIDSAAFECFARLLLEKFGKVLLVMDCAPYHVSRAMWGFYLLNSDRLKVILFPSYSPELNPTEQTWKETKKWLAVRCWKNKKELKEEIVSAFREDFVLVNFYDYLMP